MRVAVIGGGAAGFFAAIALKEMMPGADVDIFERQRRVLSKVEVSGGGRCNCTNSFESVTDLQQVYPRGARLMKRLFRHFDYRDAYAWFESHGVPLVVQDDECVFPEAQDSHAIIDCFMHEARRHGIRIHTGVCIESLAELQEFDRVIVTAGGQRTMPKYLDGVLGEDGWLEACPSLFTFNIKDARLTTLMGVVADNALTSIPGTKLKAHGPLLITHWGMSGPAILKLSSHAARCLAEQGYRAPLMVNWTGETNAEVVAAHIYIICRENPQKMVQSVRPYEIGSRLWMYLTQKAEIPAERRWGELGRKQVNRIVDVLTADRYTIDSRCHYKDEFVTCGGVSLQAVNLNTLECRQHTGLYFAGEVLDIDGVTGGFNFQAAWTTAYVVAKAIAAEGQLS